MCSAGVESVVAFTSMLCKLSIRTTIPAHSMCATNSNSSVNSS